MVGHKYRFGVLCGCVSISCDDAVLLVLNTHRCNHALRRLSCMIQVDGCLGRGTSFSCAVSMLSNSFRPSVPFAVAACLASATPLPAMATSGMPTKLPEASRTTFSPITTKDHFIPTHGLLKRPGSTDKTHLEKFLSQKVGDVLFWPRHPYSENRIIHSFGDVASLGEYMTPGTTHVAVGFVDLSQLAGAVAAWDGQDSQTIDQLVQQQVIAYGRPLKWVGYECSAPWL